MVNVLMLQTKTQAIAQVPLEQIALHARFINALNVFLGKLSTLIPEVAVLLQFITLPTVLSIQLHGEINVK